jgi:hypothetical protein
LFQGVETLFDDMMKLDPELGKMRTVKGLADQAINDFKIKYEEETEKIKEEMLIQHDRKKDERDMWQVRKMWRYARTTLKLTDSYKSSS